MRKQSLSESLTRQLTMVALDHCADEFLDFFVEYFLGGGAWSEDLVWNERCLYRK